VGDIFEHIDSRAIFVLVMIAIGAVQAIMEKVRKSRAERELNEDLAERAEQRSATIDPVEYDPPLDDLYDEYRREILDRQQRTVEETTEPEPPPPPPPLPEAAPPPLHPDTWAADEAATEAPAAPWAKPAPAPAEKRLTAAEQAAAAAFQAYDQIKRKGKGAPGRSSTPVRSLLATRSSLRTAIILKEILGPPKGISE